ncbi:MAG: hypothetical protein WCP28_01230 [Actinomycetes bacterium]
MHLGGDESVTSTYTITPGGLRTLMSTFWSSQGWREPGWPGKDEFDRAVSNGLMFNGPRTLDHDGWVTAARAAAAATTLTEVSDAFVASLTTRRLDIRSAIGSFAIARVLPEHGFTVVAGSRQCSVCGLPADDYSQDLNILNFERFKWGGVRRDDIVYVAFDLEQFSHAPRAAVTPDAITLGRDLLRELADVAPTATAHQVADRLRRLAGNQDQRRVLLEVLGMCGVLASPARPGYNVGYTPTARRVLAPGHFMDTAYPVCWWRGSDGVNQAAVAEFLPQLSA